jgi:hypothetical protein
LEEGALKIRKGLFAGAGAALLTAALVLTPGTAAFATSSTLWVSSATPVAGHGTSCNAPGYNNIQMAIDAAAAGNTIEVCPGTYTEQLTITKGLNIYGRTGGTVTVQLPANPVEDTTACDNAIETAFGGGPIQDGISVCTTGNVNMSGLTVHANWPGDTCNDNLQAILVGGGGSFSMSKSAITAAGAVPLNGCQGGLGILAGQAGASPSDVVAHIKLSNVSVSGYQKEGIKVSGAGSTGQLRNVSVIGAGPQDQIAQNGIQISGGATAKIKNSAVTGNECDDAAGGCGSDPMTGVQSAGILLFGNAKSTSIASTALSDNDIGAYNFQDGATAPKNAQAQFSHDKFVNNRYEGFVFDQGSAALSNSNVSGGNIGVAALQYDGQSFGAVGVVNNVSISGVSVAAVDIVSDGSVNDIQGKLTIENSHISGNPGPVLDNSANFVVVQNHNS